MRNFKNISLYVIEVISVIIVINNKLCFVSTQELLNTDYWTPIVASIPATFMSVINLALVSRLASNSNRGGFTSFLTGADKNQKKMIFLGKHNIQVSNSHSGGEGGEEEECCDDEEEDDYDDEECCDDEEEEEEEEEEGEEQNKNKYKKEKKGKNTYNSGKGENKSKKYSKQMNGNSNEGTYDKFGAKPYGGTGMGTMGHDYSELKNAIFNQYPGIDPGQIYFPQNAEETILQSAQISPVPIPVPLPVPQFNRNTNIPKKLTEKKKPLIPLFKKASKLLRPLSPRNEIISASELPNLSPDQLSTERTVSESFELNTYDLKPEFGYRQNDIHSNEVQFEIKPQNKYTDDKQLFEGNFQPIQDFNRWKRSIPLEKSSDNRVGNVPPLRHNFTSALTNLDALKISPHVIRFLISVVKNKALNENMFEETKKEKSYKKTNKKRLKSKPSEGEIHTKSSSNRVITSTKLPKASDKSVRQPIKFIPLDDYKNILNYDSMDPKQESRRSKKYSKYNDYEEEEEEEDLEEEEEEDCEDDCEEEEDDVEDEGHTTIQVIEKPDEKFNFGINSWMKRMFGRRRRLFGVGDNF